MKEYVSQKYSIASLRARSPDDNAPCATVLPSEDNRKMRIGWFLATMRQLNRLNSVIPTTGLIGSSYVIYQRGSSILSSHSTASRLHKASALLTSYIIITLDHIFFVSFVFQFTFCCRFFSWCRFFSRGSFFSVCCCRFFCCCCRSMKFLSYLPQDFLFLSSIFLVRRTIP
jgi:hypothetical protein